MGSSTLTKRQSKLSDGHSDVSKAPASEGSRYIGKRDWGCRFAIGWIDLALGADCAFEDLDGGAAYARCELLAGL